MKFLRNNILSILMALAIITASFINPSELGKIKVLRLPGADKIIHGLMYFSFTFTMFYENRKKLFRKRNYFYLGIIPVIFGLIIEILQPVVTRTRSGEIYDELFNLAGILLAIFLWYLIMSLGTNSKNNIFRT
ncbi:MAG: VanZ family protein [Bacteroidales bacterium]|nr:VanZ family protein [Bacteroidales bacterium]